MRDALQSARGTKQILFNICQWGHNEVWAWATSTATHGELKVTTWENGPLVLQIGARAGTITKYSGPGAFKDLDMLIN
jgi:hypothetical protein